jgi:hypothetical protein
MSALKHLKDFRLNLSRAMRESGTLAADKLAASLPGYAVKYYDQMRFYLVVRNILQISEKTPNYDLPTS